MLRVEFLRKNRRPESLERRFRNENCRKLFAHYLGDGVNDLVVASAAACGAVGDALYLIEFLLNVLKFCHGMESVLNVGICYVHTIADNLVFHKKYNLSSGNFPYINRLKRQVLQILFGDISEDIPKSPAHFTKVEQLDLCQCTV